MSNVKFWWVLVSLLLLAGCGDSCAPSLRPLHSDEVLVHVPELVGAWVNPDEATNSCTLGAAEGYQYPVACTGKNETTGELQTDYYHAHFVKLVDQLFVDLLPDLEAASEAPRLLNFTPVHSFFRVQTEGDLVRLHWVSGKWLEGLIQRAEVSIRHERLDSGWPGPILLTAAPDELQALMVRALGDEEAFGGVISYRRRRDD